MWHPPLKNSELESAITNFATAEEFLVTEGFLSSVWNAVKNLAKKLLHIVVSVWKAAIAFVKAVIGKIAKLFKSSDVSPTQKFEEDIKVTMITIESAALGSPTFNNKRDIEIALTNATKQIAEEIRMRSQIQVESSKELNELIESTTQTPVEEAKIIYNRTADFDYKGERVHRSLMGNDMIDEYTDSNPKKFLKFKTEYEKILQSGDIVGEYNALITGIVNYSHGYFSWEFNEIKKRFEEAIADGTSRDDVIASLNGQYFQIPNDPEKCKKIIQLKLNYNRRLVQLLEGMIRLNYASAGYSEEQMESLIKGIRNDDANSLDAAYDIIAKNRATIMKTKGVLDFTKFNGGKVYYHPYDDLMLEYANELYTWYSYSLKYDCIINTHGGRNTRFIGKDEKESNKLYDQMAEIDLRISELEEKKKYLTSDARMAYFKYLRKKSKIYKKEKDKLEDSKWKISRDLSKEERKSIRANIKQQITELNDRITELNKEYSYASEKQKISIQRNVETQEKMLDHQISSLMKTKNTLNKRVYEKPEEPKDPEFQALSKEFRDTMHTLSIRHTAELDDFFTRVIGMPDDGSEEWHDKFLEFELSESELTEEYDEIRARHWEEDQEVRRWFRIERKKLGIDPNAANRSRITNTWSIMPVRIGKHLATDNLDTAVRNAIKDGHKRILLIACNGYHMELSDEVKNTPGVIIRMSTEVMHAPIMYNQ